MSQSINIALVGATGSVGEALVELLEEREFPVQDLHLLASSESVGQSLPFRGRQLRVRSLDSFVAERGLDRAALAIARQPSRPRRHTRRRRRQRHGPAG